MDAEKVVTELRENFRKGIMRDYNSRIAQLNNLRNLVVENADAITEAVYQDLKRNRLATTVFETDYLEREILTTISELKEWMKPTKVSRSVLQLTDSAYVVPDPLGVTLIIAPWNFPFQLLLLPMVGALAGGNCVVIKPSEISSHSEKVLTELIEKYMSKDVCRILCGGPVETRKILEQRFDLIFYTGSTMVGKIVMQAAAEHLTPVCLELGGKCPAIIDDDVDVETAAKRIIWGKMLNCGQICIGVDYIMCVPEKKAELIESLRKNFIEMYSENPKESEDYGRIINSEHFDRLADIIKNTSGNIVFGGEMDKNDLYIKLTIIDNVKENDSTMKDELFGPVLPIIDVKNIDEAITFVNKREKPLAIYLFSGTQAHIDRVLQETSSGGVTINDVAMHATCNSLPFGGVGLSGMGSYHGKYSFKTFTHEKAILHRPMGLEKFLWMRYPPLCQNKVLWTKRMSGKIRLPFF